MKNGQVLLKHLSWIGKIVKIYEMLLKKITFLVGLGKIFGRSVKNFGRPGQFLKVWKKIRNVREKISEKNAWKKSRGSKILATTRRGEFVKFYLAPPQNACCLSNSPPNSETWRRHCLENLSIKMDEICEPLVVFLNSIVNPTGDTWQQLYDLLCAFYGINKYLEEETNKLSEDEENAEMRTGTSIVVRTTRNNGGRPRYEID